MRTAAKTQAHCLARSLRGELVHAAGCVFRGNVPCVVHAVATHEGVGWYLDDCAELGVTPPLVRVPRSLRAALGRTIGA